MYVVMNRLDVAGSDFERTFGDSMRAHLPGVPGLRRATLLQPAHGTESYVSVMEFEDEDAFKAWTRSDSFRAAHTSSGDQPPVPSAIETFRTVVDVAP